MGTFEILIVSINVVLTTVLGWLLVTVKTFMSEQRKANEANKQANRSMQRDVLYRYFHLVVEDCVRITPREFAHVEDCYNAYHANGGNGAGTLMFEKIKEYALIDTGGHLHG